MTGLQQKDGDTALQRTNRLFIILAIVAMSGASTAFAGTSHLPVVGSRAACARARAGSASCLARVLTINGQDFHPDAPSFRWPPGINPVTPGDLDAAYSLSAITGPPQTIAIVDPYDDPGVRADLNAYRQAYGLPALSCDASGPCFRVVDQSGGLNLPTPNEGWAAEISLDVDAVSAVCPWCNVLLIEPNSNNNSDMFAGVDQAVHLGATVISMSWGGSETLKAGSSILGYDSHFARSDVAFVAASGDTGFGAAEYPASSPNVIAVGGTTLRPATNARGWDESVWSGSGSGCSTFELKPAWQKDLGCATRMVADVSADGDPGTGLIMYDSFGGKGPWYAGGGTSLSAPIFAGLIARSGGNHGQRGASAFYGSSGFNDITRGSNFALPATGPTQEQKCSVYLCAAAAGYDGPTGVGTPNGAP